MYTKAFVVLPLIATLAACSGGLWSTGNNTNFERVGADNCTGTLVPVAGTASDPVRCGPQAQPITQ